MDLKAVEAALQQADGALKSAVDASLQLMATSTDEENKVYTLWEKYMGEWWGYLKQKSQEKGVNPLAGISYARLRQKLNV
ncbi:MAG: hypothetical protein PWQ18_255 [Clostridia bacterium]|nr:hypothetical protein [Clostridia bacterium]